MRLVASLALCLMMLGGVASPTLAATSIPSFHTPTGNIGCEMAGGWLRCDIGQKSWGKPARPQGCQLDYGDSFSLKATGKPIWSCHGDTALHLGRVLAYGTTWHVGAFTCVSRITGLTCTNSQGHGFFLSRQSYRLF